MKKLLVLALVLGMATMANAGLVLSPMPTEVLTGGTFTIDITSNAIISAGVGEYAGFGLVVETSLASLAGGLVVNTTDPGVSLFDGVMAGAGFPPPAGTEGVSGTVLAVNGPIAANMLFQGITFTAGQLVGLATVTLVGTQDYATLEVLGSAQVLITPEPMTMALLGLGGLFIRRRK